MIYIDLLLTGIGLGAMYGTAAIGFNLIFSTTRVFDIAIGASYLISGYCYYLLVSRFDVPWPLALVAAMLSGAASEVVFSLGIYRWVARRSSTTFFGYFVASFGILIIVQNLLQIGFGSDAVFVGPTLIKPLRLGAISVDLGIFVAIAAALCCFLVVRVLLQRTEAGVIFRTLGENRQLLRTLGRSGERYHVLAFAMGGALVAVSAVVLVSLNGLTPADGFVNANLAIAAVLVGGVGSYAGGMLGGVLLGAVSNLALQWVSGGWIDAVAFACLLVVLLVRPGGMLKAQA